MNHSAMNNSAFHSRATSFAAVISTSDARLMSASPSGPGPPAFAAPASYGMDMNCQRSKRMKINHDMTRDRLEISPPSPSILATTLSSPSAADAQILSPATIFQSMEHGSVDGLTPEGLNSLKSLNFTTGTEEGDDYVYARKQKTPRDPMSHRIIEKRRRDRMNNCLADLSRLIPPHFIKQGQGRIEKTEIIEMAIKHLKHLHSILPKEEMNSSGIDFSKTQTDDDKQKAERFLLGYKECGTELMRFLMDQEGLTTKDRLFIRVVNHLAEREKNIKLKAMSPEFIKTLDTSTIADQTASNLASSSISAAAAAEVTANLPDIKQLAKDASETTSTNDDLRGSDEARSASSGFGSGQMKKASVRSQSSGYASAHTATTNRSLREELRLSEAELEEERIKSQQTAVAKGKNDDRNDSTLVSVTKTSLRDLLNNPDPSISIYNYDGDTNSTISSFSVKQSKNDGKKKDHHDPGICEDSTSADVIQSQLALGTGHSELNAKMTTDSSSSGFNYKKDLKLRFTNEGEEHGQECSGHANKPTAQTTHTHNSHSNRMRGHNSKDSKDKIMEGFIKMKRKQEQEEKTEEGHSSFSHSSPASPETSSIDTSCPSSSSTDKSCPSSSTIGVPCFALHPSGTFYIPIAIHPSVLQDTLEKKFTAHAPTLCHPVSIPVNFTATDNSGTGANFSLHNINVGAKTSAVQLTS